MKILVDTCTWLDIAIQVTSYNRLLKLRGGNAITISGLANKLFGVNHEFFVCDMIRSEIDSYFIRKNYNPVSIDSRNEYALKTQVSEQIDTAVPDNLKKYLNDYPQGRSQDREIFLSGKGEDIDVIITQNRRDFSKLHKKYFRLYNPELKSCILNEQKEFSGLETFSPRFSAHDFVSRRKKKNESYAHYILRWIKSIMID